MRTTMTNDAPEAAATAAQPTQQADARDYAIARLTRQRAAAEQLVDALSATIAALERDKAEMADRLAALMAQTGKEETANG